MLTDFECTTMCFFDLKLWQRGEILKGVEERDVDKVPMQWFRKVNSKPDEKEGSDIVQEPVKRKRGRPRILPRL